MWFFDICFVKLLRYSRTFTTVIVVGPWSRSDWITRTSAVFSLSIVFYVILIYFSTSEACLETCKTPYLGKMCGDRRHTMAVLHSWPVLCHSVKITRNQAEELIWRRLFLQPIEIELLHILLPLTFAKALPATRSADVSPLQQNRFPNSSWWCTQSLQVYRFCWMLTTTIGSA